MTRRRVWVILTAIVLIDAAAVLLVPANDGSELRVTQAALANASVFYGVTVVVFLFARRTPLNWALALQKALWFVVVALMTLPLYWLGEPLLPQRVRMLVWLDLSLTTWWVLYEVFSLNWEERMRAVVRATYLHAQGIVPARVGRQEEKP